MKIKHLNIALLAAAGLLFYSCDKDFLNVPSQEIIEAEDGGETKQPVAFVNGVYGMFTDWDYAFAFLGITEIISDNADKGSSPTDPGGDKIELDNLTFTATTSSSKDMWTRWYKTIGRAGESIKYTESFPGIDANMKNRLIAEARFLRAVCYFYLVRGFGEVPIQDKDITKRESVEAVYDYIKEDLQFAITNLPEKNAYPAADLGRATKGAAQGLLAKVNLYQGDWQNAVTNAQAVIGSGQYSLEPDYAKIWRVETENGKESLFEIQGRGESIAHGINQYSQTQGPRGGAASIGWGFNTPTQNLLDAFNAEKDAIRRDATIIFRNEIMYDGTVIGNTENPMYNEKAYSSANKGSGDGDKNIRYLRLSEVYLILAEASNEMGNSAQALTALNMVRTRVKLPSITETNQGTLRNLIWKERRLELAMEHDRWFDLLRTKQAESAMKANGKPFVAKHYLFPIPVDQLLQTPDMTQNTGW